MPPKFNKVIKLTPDEDLYRDLEAWAKQEDRPIANLVTRIARKAVDEAIESGKYKPRQNASRKHSQISVLDLQKLADQLGIPSDRLLKAIKEIKLEVVNGSYIND